MSHCSRHTTTELPVLGRYCVTYEYTQHEFNTISWDELLAEDWDADGNTKWSRDKPVLAFLKANLYLVGAMKILGYAGYWDKGVHKYSTKDIVKRIETRGVGRLLPLLRALMEADLMPHDCKDLLQKRKRPAKLAIEFANEIISASVKKWGTREKALAKLKIDEELAVWWESHL